MYLRKTCLLVCGFAVFPMVTARAGELDIAANSMNALGLDLLARVAQPAENALLSPYSIQSALAMTYAGAAGETKAEMAKVLHYPDDEAALHSSFAAFARELNGMAIRSRKGIERSGEYGGPAEPVVLEVANRLYGQSGYDFRPEFLALTKESYGAAFQAVNFKHDSERIRKEINRWTAAQTCERIQDIVPVDGVNALTRLALINAVYFKTPWAHDFSEHATAPESFWCNGAQEVKVPMMKSQRIFGYRHNAGFTAVTISYVGDELQLLILLPDKQFSLANFEKTLTPAVLADSADVPKAELILHLPKFKLEPPVISLAAGLQAMGMLTAFDQPSGSANFDRMAPRRTNGYLALSSVLHRSFIAVDEKGTEAAAATAIVALVTIGVEEHRPKPIEVKIDHPFIFVIQHRMSGACLFLGRVVDPR